MELFIQYTIEIKKANWNAHILLRSYILKHGFEGKIKGGIEVKGRRGRRRRKEILDDFKETKRSWKLQEEPLDHTLRRTCFGRVTVGNE